MTAPFDSIPQYIDEEEEESAGMECKTESRRLTYQIVQLRGPGFSPQLSERRSVLRPLEKPATGSCNCVAPDSLLNCQREEALIAFWRSLRLECKQKEKKQGQKKSCGAEFTPRVSFGEKRRRYESSSNTREENTREEKRDRLGR
ncbi:unnamed protein product [Sphagnum balticum]